MTATATIDAGRLSLALTDLRLPAIKLVWADFAARADKEGWPAARFLAALAEHEMAERANRRIRRHLEEAKLPPDKTIDSFDFEAVPMVSKAQVMALAAGDSWLKTGANLLAFGPPGTGKSHLAIALAMKACEHGFRVAFATAQEWVSRLEAAQDRNQLEDELRRLERYHLIVVDEVGYLPLERQAANLLSALVSRRYERGSIIVTSNRSFEHWGEILGDAMVAAALIDRLVHHATMVTLKGKSYRLRERGTAIAPAAQAPPLRGSA
jgi:DNA replication protein DnaC